MTPSSREEHEHFENEVRRIARELWPSAQFSGSRVLDGKERDGIFETEESVHLIEATVSRRKVKSEQDCKKLAELARRYERSVRDRSVQCWFITRDEPTSEQREVATRYRVRAVSRDQFQARLIDSKNYLAARDKYYFGSVRDPQTGDSSHEIKFIPLALSAVKTGEPTEVTDILSQARSGGRIVVLGDYGAGKSMTLRYLYHELRRSHLRGDTSQFPVFVNLRDHYGQRDPAELLERHARIIGFASPWHLVRAWRAGYVHLLLDGFDETTSLNLQGLWTRLRQNRFRAMEVVRRLTQEHPEGAGLVLAGRAHFFDSSTERRSALGLGSAWAEYSLNEFTDDQIRLYLQEVGLSGSVPNWLPSRPLLVAYLAARGLLAELVTDQGADPASGWDILLDSISSREAQIEAGIDGETIRRILERLATRARASESGLGPLNPEALLETFRDVCGHRPDERGMVLLQRLPGLGSDQYEEGSRAFIDAEFTDACRAGDVFQFAMNPYQFGPESFEDLDIVTGTLGIAIAVRKAVARGLTAGQFNAAVRRAMETSSAAFVADIARAAMSAGHDLEDRVVISGVLIPECDVSSTSGKPRQLEFRDCFFRRLEIDHDVNDGDFPRFVSCYIGEVDGRVSRADLPSARFDENCVIEGFTREASTTAEVLSLGLPLGTRVTLTILKKLFERPGSGRRESALYRGLDQRAQALVGAALRAIQRERIAMPIRRGNETIWLPDRAALRRVGQIIAAPAASNDPLLERVADL